MARMLRLAAYVVIAVLLLVLAAAVWVWVASEHKLNGDPAAASQPFGAVGTEQITDAQRQLHVLGCIGCHGKGLRGALMIDEPNIARVYAPNLTLIARIHTDQQLAEAIQQGIGTDGRSLVIMPSATFSRLSRPEVEALIGVIRTLPEGGQPTPPREIGLLGRIGLVGGQFRTQPDDLVTYRRKMPIDLGPTFAGGRHLVAARCAECHGPDLAGSDVEPGVTAPDLTIAGAYDLPAFKTLLRTGVPPGGRKLKMMGDVARNDFSYYSDDEIKQIHAYLVARAQRLAE